ncbi:hypothetical protein BDP27DRAFT_1185298, partial [Rhodocollybia butyracea]
QPRVLLFFDSNSLALRVAKFLNAHAPPHLHNKGFSRHYYSTMSPEYLDITHESFNDPNGSCRILCATAGESVGIDHHDVRLTANIGVVDPSDGQQRGGRNDRLQLGGVHITLYEEWAQNVKLDEFENKDLPFASDPDRPRTFLKKGSNKRERAPRSGIEYIQCTCVRKFLAMYNGDTSSSCMS